MKSINPRGSTAMAGAAVRALESLRPEQSRLFADEYAATFLLPRHRALLAACRVLRPVRTGMEWILNARYPGVPTDFICRTRYIDDAFAAFARAAKPQRLAILGAGYDGRALRLAGADAAGMDLIELDQPLVQQRKRQLLEKRHCPAASRIRFVGHDLHVRPLDSEAVREAFKDRPARTFFVLEGVTGYLSREAVDGVFELMAAYGAPGSRAVFTYVEESFVMGEDRSGAATRIRRYLEKVGEPFVLGLNPDTLASFCQDRGFRLLETVSAVECAHRYLAPLGRTGFAAADFFHIATVERHARA